MNIAMAIFDFIPVIAFLIGSILLQRDLYNKMSKGAFALFSAGTLFVITAGLFKATYKFLFYTNICAFEPLNKCFFPMQTTGFVLAGLGTLAMLFHPQGENREYALAFPVAGLIFLEAKMGPVTWDGTILFVIFMILGVAILDGALLFMAIKKKCILAIIIIPISFVAVLGMGYLSTKPELSDWIKEIVNTIGQGGYLAAAIALRKCGLAEYQLEPITKKAAEA